MTSSSYYPEFLTQSLSCVCVCVCVCIYIYIYIYISVQFSSVTQSCPTLCDPVNHSMPGLPVHHQLPEFTQTHVHRVSDAIQPSHPLLSPSLPDPGIEPGSPALKTDALLCEPPGS